MKKAVHFGAGNIGRGFLGQLYCESGYETTFVDVVDTVVKSLQERKGYTISIVSERGEEEFEVTRVDAVYGRDLIAVTQALAEADIASTAVGVNALKFIVPPLAAGIATRFSDPDAAPLNIIVCENLINAGSYLRNLVRQELAPEFHDALETKVGFVEASIGRMVPVPTEEQKARDPLAVMVEPYCELPVDAEAFRGPIPEIEHMKALKNFGAYVERKLFVHNMSHSATAFLGWLRQHEFVWQAIRDVKVRSEVELALGESCGALAAKHDLDERELEAHAKDLLERYANRALNDSVQRVCADPVRKLGSNDRIIGAAKMCLAYNMEPRQIAYIAAAATHFSHPQDSAAQHVQDIRQREGLAGVLSQICGIEPDSHLAGLVRDGEARLRREGWVH